MIDSLKSKKASQAEINRVLSIKAKYYIFPNEEEKTNNPFYEKDQVSDDENNLTKLKAKEARLSPEDEELIYKEFSALIKNLKNSSLEIENEIQDQNLVLEQADMKVTNY